MKFSYQCGDAVGRNVENFLIYDKDTVIGVDQNNQGTVFFLKNKREEFEVFNEYSNKIIKKKIVYDFLEDSLNTNLTIKTHSKVAKVTILSKQNLELYLKDQFNDDKTANVEISVLISCLEGESYLLCVKKDSRKKIKFERKIANKYGIMDIGKIDKETLNKLVLSKDI